MADAVAQRAWVARVLGVDAPAAAPSLVSLGKARLDWGPIRTRAVADILSVKAALAETFADDVAQQAVLRAALVQMDGLVDQLDISLEDRLDALLNATAAARPAALAEALAALRSFATFLTTDPLMSCIDGNELLPNLRIAAPLRAGLAEIAAALR